MKNAFRLVMKVHFFCNLHDIVHRDGRVVGRAVALVISVVAGSYP